jgi:fatty-acyl-CoA synthase
MIDEVAPALRDLENVIYFDTDDWSELIDAGRSVSDDDLAARAESLDARDPINIQYTSGTTGRPKGATLSHRSILNNARFVGDACAYTEEDRVCIPIPFYHCFGMVMGNLACSVFGATMVVPSPTFDPEAVLRALQDERCTSLYGVPTMFVAQLGHPGLADFDLSSMRTGIMAGSPCPTEVMRRVIDDMGMSEVTIAYGMTETSPVSTQTSTDDSVEHRVSTVGRVLPHVESKIVDPDTGELVPRGEGGEYCTRGYHVMLGYWNDPEKTADAIDADGWMHSGDLATMDDDGYVNIVGRIKDMIIRGGENIYPREIEEFLCSHPAIADAQVIGVPDEKYGEELMAWVQFAPGGELTEDELRDFCRAKIAYFKVPRYIKFVSEFPMTVTGKVRKVEMRDKSIAELGLDAPAANVTA